MKFSPADHLGAVQRSVSITTRDGRPMRVVGVFRNYDAAPDEVWDALTTPERIERWLAPTTGEFRLGGRFTIKDNASGEILACEKPKLLRVTWEYGGQVSWVDATLNASDEGTSLVVEHTGAVPPEMWDQFGPGAVGIGWEMMLMGLAEHLERPDEALPDPASPEMVSPLNEFMVLSSAAWADASVTAGTDPGQARAAADRCFAFYTGNTGAGD